MPSPVIDNLIPYRAGLRALAMSETAAWHHRQHNPCFPELVTRGYGSRKRLFFRASQLRAFINGTAPAHPLPPPRQCEKDPAAIERGAKGRAILNAKYEAKKGAKRAATEQLAAPETAK